MPESKRGPIVVDARVRYTGRDFSDLFFGPGIVTKVAGDYAWARPTVGGDLRAFFPSGHVVSTKSPSLYSLRKLALVTENDCRVCHGYGYEVHDLKSPKPYKRPCHGCSSDGPEVTG